MWIINFLPDFVFHLITIGGLLALVASFILGFIPFVKQYKLPIQVGGIIALVFGLYFEGAMSNEAVWQEKVKELEAKVAQAEIKSVQANVKIVEKIVTKDKIIRERQDAIVQYIDREIVKYDNECKIPEAFISTHNKATEQVK